MAQNTITKTLSNGMRLTYSPTATKPVLKLVARLVQA